MGAAVNSCMGKTSTAPELPKTAFPWFLPIVGLSDASAVNPGIFMMFISHLLSLGHV